MPNLRGAELKAEKVIVKKSISICNTTEVGRKFALRSDGKMHIIINL